MPFVTDGPYAETKAVLAGYWIAECDSSDRATEQADFGLPRQNMWPPTRMPTYGRRAESATEVSVQTRGAEKQRR